MNFIAHLHLAWHTQTSLVGNFLGDFYKGPVKKELDVKLQIGIQLHRKIDSYTDSHPLVMASKDLMPNTLRRYSGFALDIYFDHLLLSNWAANSKVGLAQLLDQFYDELAAYQGVHNPAFANIKQSLLASRWLSHYANQKMCFRALQSIEQRLSKPVDIAQPLYENLSIHHRVLQKHFLEFYPQLSTYAQQQALSIGEKNSGN